MKREFGYTVKVGIELEFIIFKGRDNNGKLIPVETNNYSSFPSLLLIQDDFIEIKE